MQPTKVTLDQWVVFEAVVDAESFAQAAKKLHKSQSTISYAISKMQTQLNTKLFEIHGRKAVLTDAGQKLLGHAKRLTRIARDIEAHTTNLENGLECELNIAVDELFPRELLVSKLKAFGLQNTYTQLNLSAGLLSGPTQALVDGNADIIITSKVPQHFVGYKIIEIEEIACAHVDNKLHAMTKPIKMSELVGKRNIIATDSGPHNRDEGWLGSQHCWKVSSLDLKFDLIAQGVGFAWLPKYVINNPRYPVKPLDLAEGNCRKIPLYVVAQPLEMLGPAARQLLAIMQQA